MQFTEEQIDAQAEALFSIVNGYRAGQYQRLKCSWKKVGWRTLARQFLQVSQEGESGGIGVKLISEERVRQVKQEKWSYRHDDVCHFDGSLALAAAAYAMAAVSKEMLPPKSESLVKWAECLWPWDKKFWKPSDQERDLVKAGALIAAEIDRLRRRDPINLTKSLEAYAKAWGRTAKAKRRTKSKAK